VARWYDVHKFYSLLLVLALTCPVFAQSNEALQLKYVPAFGGINNFNDSSRIDNIDAKDARNVITDAGWLEKRTGTREIGIVVPGYITEYIKEYIAPSRTRYMIAHTSDTIWQSDFSSTFTVVSTIAENSKIDSLTAFGRHYISDGSTVPWYWNTTSSQTVPTMPPCFLMEFADDRLYCANTTANPSTLYASRYADPSDWTLTTADPMPDDDPMSWNFYNNDGDIILCLRKTPWGVVLGKGYSMHILKGTGNDTYHKRIIATDIGCADDRSMQMVRGKLHWLSFDGVYQWDGTNPPKDISWEITSTIDEIRQLNSQLDSWKLTSAADWALGTITDNGDTPSWDITTQPGDVSLSSWTDMDNSIADFEEGTFSRTTTTADGSVVLNWEDNVVVDAFADGNYNANPTWTAVGDAGWSVVSQVLQYYNAAANKTGYLWLSTDTLSHGKWGIDLTGTSGGSSQNTKMRFYFISSTVDPATTDGYALELYPIQPTLGTIYLYRVDSGVRTTLATATNVSLSCSGISINRNTNGYFNISACGSTLTSTDTTHSPYTPSKGLILQAVGASNYAAKHQVDNIKTPANYISSGSHTSPIMDNGMFYATGGPLTVSSITTTDAKLFHYIKQSSSAYGVWTDWSASSDTLQIATTQQWWQRQDRFYNYGISTVTPVLQSVEMSAVSTGTYYLPLKYVTTDITSWMITSFENSASRSGLVSYYVRSATWPYVFTAAAPAWTAFTNNTIPSISTAAYYNFRIISDGVGSSSDTYVLKSMSSYWKEGESRPVSSLAIDDAYHLRVNTSLDTAESNLELVYQTNDKWTIFDGQLFSSMAMFDRYPVAAEATTDSKLLRLYDEGVYSDNGQAIDAWWISKDFIFDLPNQRKIIRRFYMESQPDYSGTMTLGYAVNKSTTHTTTTVTISSDTVFNAPIEDMFDGYIKDKYVNFKFRNAVDNEFLKVNGYSLYFQKQGLYGED